MNLTSTVRISASIAFIAFISGSIAFAQLPTDYKGKPFEDDNYKIKAASMERIITQKDLRSKIEGYWLGQMVGNFMGYPFENLYYDEPVPFLVQRYYFWRTDRDSVKVIHSNLRNGFVDILAESFEGGFSDDDTDIEFVTLFAVEKYGLDITYPQITEMWKKHINRRIWCANLEARKLMDKGLIPPATGAKENNNQWHMIDAQLVNEIWSIFYPGMLKKAAARAEWGAKITNDDWATYPTVAYGIIYSAAFFEGDVNKLVDLAYTHIPKNNPFSDGMKDVIAWHKQNTDWRVTRKLVVDKYTAYKSDKYNEQPNICAALQNGLLGIMAILYGEGDFMKTTGIAVSAGMDCDNQAATCAGIIGTMHGSGCIPYDLTRKLSSDGTVWKEPFNNQYLNYTRDDLPVMSKISDLVDRIMVITEKSILENGGKKITQNGEDAFVVNCDF